MKAKNIIVSIASLSIVLTLSTYSYKAKAADISSNQAAVQAVKNFTPKTNVGLSKTWTVSFNDEIDETTIGNNIKVTDNVTGSAVNVTFKLSSDKKSVQIFAPANGYDVNKNYSISVGNKIESLKAKNLAQSAELDFTTAAIQSTDSLQDINTTVGVMPTLPSKVNAVLTDGSSAAFDINWDNLSQTDISTAGTIKLQGTLKNTNYKVSVNVVVATAAAGNTDTAFLKQFSADLGNVEAKISDTNERNVVIALKSAVDANISNPSQSLNAQPAKDAYHSLTAAEQADLQSIMLSNFSLQELLQARALF